MLISYSAPLPLATAPCLSSRPLAECPKAAGLILFILGALFFTIAMILLKMAGGASRLSAAGIGFNMVQGVWTTPHACSLPKPRLNEICANACPGLITTSLVFFFPALFRSYISVRWFQAEMARDPPYHLQRAVHA